MDRRRSLLAASQTGGGGGSEFYVDLYLNNPRYGEQFFRTAIFVIDGEKTWEEAAGLKDIEEWSQIVIMPLPKGGEIPTIESLSSEDDYNQYMPSTNIYSSDKIIIGHTYKFITE